MKTKLLVAILAIMLSGLSSVHAQVSIYWPFDGTTFSIKEYNSNYVVLSIPFYDERDFGYNNDKVDLRGYPTPYSDEYDRRLSKGYIEYSTNDGMSYVTLLEITIGRSQSNESWYWLDVKKSSGITSSITTNETRAGLPESVVSNEWQGKQYYRSNTNVGSPAFATFKWYHQTFNNQPVIFRFRGDLCAENGKCINNFVWYLDNVNDKRAVVFGNPLNKPGISSYSIGADAKLSVNVNIPGFSLTNDMGTKDVKNGLFLETKTSGFDKNGSTVAAPTINNYTASLQTLTTSAVLSLAQLNNGETVKVGSFRGDYYCTAPLSGNMYTIKYSDVYTIPPYPQPYNLQVQDLKNGKLRLTWNMYTGTDKSPTDGFSFQWAKSGEDWTKDGHDFTPSVQYDKSKTAYSIEIDNPVTYTTNALYYFRIKRANLNWTTYHVEHAITIDPKPAEIQSLTFDVATKKVSWTFGPGVVKSNWKYDIIANKGSDNRVVVSGLSYTLREYTDSSIPTCVATKYTVQIKENGADIQNYTGKDAAIVPSNMTAKVTLFDVSKGFYTNRVSLVWKVERPDATNFTAFSIYRKEKHVPGAIEEFLKEIQASNTENSYRFDDNTASPGVYYDYILRPIVQCGGQNTIVTSIASTGFTQSYGTVSGRVAYAGSSAVEGVDVLVQGTGSATNRTLEFNPASKKYVEVPYKEGLLSPTEFSYQAWIKIIPPFDQWRYLFTAAGRYEVTIKDANAVTLCFNNNAGVRTYQSFATTLPSNSNQFIHLTITSKVTDVATQKGEAKLYINGEYVETMELAGKGNQFAANAASLFQLGANNSNQLFNGYMDEVRLWKKALTAEEIKQNYNRYIAGSEEGLTAYYRFDELETDEVFDISGRNGVFNQNHGKIKGDEANKRNDIEVPTATQLAIKGVTDKNGHYLINTIPFLGDGNQYTIVPALGVHKFNPSDRPLFFNAVSPVHNNVDFTDVSSFKVSGKVYYEGGNYPVEGCSFKVDGRTVTRNDGSVITTDTDGTYTIDVPIGQHEVQVVKNGHTFVANGLLLEGGQNKVFMNDLSDVHFKDITKVKLIGHVVGGKVEHNKAVGFGETRNNIGVEKLVLKAKKTVYSFTNPNDQSEEFTFNYKHNDGQWKRNAAQEYYSKVAVKGNEITVHVNDTTGEFVAWVYPEMYEIQDINVANNVAINPVYSKKEVLDLSNAAVSDANMLSRNIRNWSDSVLVKGTGKQKDHYVSVAKADTVSYHKQWTYFYQAQPTYSVQQLENNETVGYFGEKTFDQQNPLTGNKHTVTLVSGDEATGYTYAFGKPVFSQGKTYRFALKAYEEYINYKATPNATYTAPVLGGTAFFSNALALADPEPVELDSTGNGVYTFLAGAPDLTTGIKAFSTSLVIDNIGYLWNRPEADLQAFLLGARTTGTDFMTAGPDAITAVLHDPPGSKSYAFFEKGTTITKMQSLSVSDELKIEVGTEIDLGTKITTFVGLGAGVITDVEVIAEVDANLETSITAKGGTETETETTFTERFETSDDPMYVAHLGDVFIGNSTNIQYGLTNSVTILPLAEVADVADVLFPLDGSSSYVIAKSQGMAVGQTFGTRFAYTEVELENIMIPKWKDNLKLLLKPLAPSQVNPALITHPVYCSVLPVDDPNFGRKNTDKIFGNNAASAQNYYNGPSYVTVFPNGYTQSEKMKSYVDSVIYYNNQIERWEQVLAENEKEKVEMKTIGNYSFGSGAKIEWSNSKSESKTTNFDFSFVVSPSIGLRSGVEVCGMEMVVTAKETMTISTETSTSSGTSEEKTVGFVLQEEGDDDQITVDYGWTKSGTIAFKARGGRTSCPYEGEVRTKYYQPGQHILSEGTMRIEVPVLTVKGGAYAVKVPSSRPATFILELKNESETNENVWYKLMVDENTNSNGAELKIDGSAIGNGRMFMVEAGKVLEKTLIVNKGPVADRYDDIRLLLVSLCQYDPTGFGENIFAETKISAEFIPSCSDITVKTPLDKWTVNTETGDSLVIVANDYDINFSHFDHVELQYKPSNTSEWKNLMNFYADQTKYTAAQGLKTLLKPTDTYISYVWKMNQEVDGNYDVRAKTVCASNGNVIAETESIPVSGIKDMVRPKVFGKPQPADGILSATSDILIQFNKDLAEGMITTSNFTIEGVKAGARHDHYTSVHFNGTSDYMDTEHGLDLNGKSFTVEMWVKRNQTGAATIFSHGADNNQFAIGFAADNKLQVTVGNQVYTGKNPLANTAEWGHIAVTYNAANGKLNAYYAIGSSSTQEIDNQQAVAYTGNGKIRVGRNAAGNNYAAADIHGLKLWSRVLDKAAISSGLYNLLLGNEIGLLGYWPMNEGKGLLIKDKARSRHAQLHGNWKLLPEGKAISFTGSDSYLDINTGSSVVISPEKDFTIEMWFKTASGNGALFSCGRGDGQLETATNNTLSIYLQNGKINVASAGKVYEVSTTSVADDKWHHFALSVKRTGTANMYTDGLLNYYVEGLEFGSLAGANMSIGARKWKENTTAKSDLYFNGHIDEVRIWNMALTENYIANFSNTRLRGSEVGLIAYYPFDEYVLNNNNQKELTFSLRDQVSNASTPVAVTNNGSASAETAPVKDAGPLSSYAFEFVSNKDKVLLNLLDNKDVIEHTYVTITAQNLKDKNGNRMASPVTWHAYISQAFLRWQDESLSITKEEGSAFTFKANIVNNGGAVESFTIENIPSWLTVTPASGSVQANRSMELTFTVNAGLNIGSYEETLYLSGSYREPITLNVNVTGKKPSWTVDAGKYDKSMSVF